MNFRLFKTLKSAIIFVTIPKKVLQVLAVHRAQLANVLKLAQESIKVKPTFVDETILSHRNIEF